MYDYTNGMPLPHVPTGTTYCCGQNPGLRVTPLASEDGDWQRAKGVLNMQGER